MGMSVDEADGFGLRGTNEGSKLAGTTNLWLLLYCKLHRHLF